MAVSKFIQAVKDETRGRPRSTQWYRDKIKEFGKPGAQQLIRDGKRDNKPFYGKLNMFFYDPKNFQLEVRVRLGLGVVCSETRVRRNVFSK